MEMWNIRYETETVNDEEAEISPDDLFHAFVYQPQRLAQQCRPFPWNAIIYAQGIIAVYTEAALRPLRLPNLHHPDQKLLQNHSCVPRHHIRPHQLLQDRELDYV